jgi:hypothetical protein
VRIPRDGERCFHGIVNSLERRVARCSPWWKGVHDHGESAPVTAASPKLLEVAGLHDAATGGALCCQRHGKLAACSCAAGAGIHEPNQLDDYDLSH